MMQERWGNIDLFMKFTLTLLVVCVDHPVNGICFKAPISPDLNVIDILRSHEIEKKSLLFSNTVCHSLISDTNE